MPEARTHDWIDLALKYGAGTAIGLYLVFALAGEVKGNQVEILAETRATRQDLRELSYYMRAICFNTAKTPEAAAACAAPPSK